MPCVREDLQITWYRNADYSGDFVERKPTSDFVLLLSDDAILWMSKKQLCIVGRHGDSICVSCMGYFVGSVTTKDAP